MNRKGLYSGLFLVLILALGLVVLLAVAREQWFIADEWNFIARRSLPDPTLSIWWPHNEHWSMIPVLVWRALFSWFGVRSYTPYLLPLYVVHLGLAFLLWRIMRRAGVRGLIAGPLTAVFVVLGAGADNLLWAFQLTFVGAVMLGVLAVFLVDSEEPGWVRLASGVAALVLGLMFSSTVLPLVAVTTVVAWVRRGGKAPWLVAGIPAVVYATWLVWFGRYGLERSFFTLSGLLDVPGYVWTGLVEAVERPTGLEGAGPLIILALGFWLLRRPSNTETALVPAALTIGAVLLYVLIGPGRVAFGIEQARAERYVYIAWALLLPAVGLALQWFASGSSVRLTVVLLLIGFIGAHNLSLLVVGAEHQARVEAGVRRRILAAASLARSGELVFDVSPDSAGAPDLLMSDVRVLDREGKLPPVTGLREEDYLGAAQYVQLNLSPAAQLPVGVEPLPQVAGLSHASLEASSREGCVMVRRQGEGASVILSVSRPAAVVLRAPSGDSIGLTVQSLNPSSAREPKRVVPFPPGQDVYLDIAVVNRLAVIDLPPAPYLSICGVAAPRAP